MKIVGIVFLIALLSLPMAMAKSSRSLIKSLNKLNSKPLALSINQCSDDPEYLILVSGEDQALLQQCAVELCGKANELVSGRLIDRNFDEYVEEGVVNRFPEVEKELVELIKNDVTKNKKFIKEFKEKIQEGKFDFKFDEWSPSDYEILSGKVYSEHVQVVIDQKLAIPERLLMKAIYPDDASAAFKKGLDNYIEKQKQLLLSDPQEALYENFYTKDEAKALLLNRWEKFYKQYQEKLKENPEFLKDRKTTIDEVIEAAKTTTGDPFSTANTLSSIHLLELEFVKATTGTYPDEVTISKCAEEACLLGIQDFLKKQDYSLRIAELEKANNAPDLSKEKLIMCKSNLASKGLKASDSESFLKLAPEIKKVFLANVTKGFSEHSRIELENYLTGSLNLSFKLGKEEAPVQTFIDGIHNSYKEFQKKEESIGPEETDVPEVASTSDILGSMFDFDPYGIGMDPLAQARYCEPQMGSAIWDAFVPQKHTDKAAGEDLDLTKDNIQVSKFSCSHHSHGKSVVAHEMGHAMSFAFAEGKLSESSLTEFLKLRACANSHHKDPSKIPPYPDLTHKGDILQTEEDTADLVAFMTYPDDDVIFECALLETTTDGQRYTELGLENSYAQDPHSSPLFRAITEANHKRKTLPAACTKLMQENTKFGLESCF